jgi:hypothetical protein
MSSTTTDDFYSREMPPSKLSPIYPKGPLNLNADGTTITYRKSHMEPNAAHWAQADAEGMERLFKSGTLRPILYSSIPANKNASYVNPVCSEKLKDYGALKLRTRATIGGDKISYPFTTTAITAELKAIKILLNGMILTTLHSRQLTSKTSTWALRCPIPSTSESRQRSSHHQ